MLAALLLFLAVLGFVFATLVLRADARRWDNRVFAAIGIIDGITAGYRALMVLGGWSLDDLVTLRTCTGLTAALAWATLEFAYSFPFSRRLPWRFRLPGLLYGGALLLFYYLSPVTDLTVNLLSWSYFLPMFAIELALIARNLRRLTGDRKGILMVAGAIGLRWLAALSTYMIARHLSPAVFSGFLFFEATAASLAGYIIIGYAVLRSHLFSVRGMVAMLLVSETLVLAVVALTALAVEAALAIAPGPVALRALLVSVALVPIGLVALAQKLRRRLEDVVLPRRALRRDAVAGVAWNEARPAALVASVKSALQEVTGRGQVRFLGEPGGDGPLPPALARALGDGSIAFLRRGRAHGLPRAAAEELEALGADLLVSARVSGRLFGALTATGGAIDRESLLAATDLADRLALKLENLRLFGELEESQRLAALGAFAAAVAHDLRTPLTSVQMNMQMLRRKARDPDDVEHFDIALEELKRLGGHIHELLDFAKPVQLHAVPVDVREVADDTARGMEPILAERKLVLEREDAPGLPAVRGDAQRLRQVLTNLLDNAARASSDGGSIVLRTRAENGRVAVEVADGGSGIEAADLPRLFEPFFTTRPDGTGLGLAICQKLVKAHAGEIQVKSTPGVGSVFTVLLPAA